MKTYRELKTQSAEIGKMLQELAALAEPSFHEFETTMYIYRYLQKHGVPVDTLLDTGLFGTIDAGKEFTVAFRADIDALPVNEDNSEYQHLCGHHAHIAGLLFALPILHEMRDLLPFNIRFIFQPAEEIISGARMMIDKGALEGVSRIIGLHVDPYEPVGCISLKKGPMMAGSNHFKLIFTGKAVHAAKPHEGTDVIVAASHFIQTVQSVISRMIDPVKPGLISFGKINAGTASNILPENLVLEGTFRYFDAEVGDTIVEKMKQAAIGTEQMYGTFIEFEIEPGVPPVKNDDEFTEQVWNAVDASELTALWLEAAAMSGEDFALYSELMPATFAWLGIREGDHHPQLHSRNFYVPESAAVAAVAFWCAVVRNLWR